MKKLLVLAILAASMSANATNYNQPKTEANATIKSNLQNSNKSSNLNNLSNRSSNTNLNNLSNRSSNTNLNNLSNRSSNTNTAKAISGDSISKSINDNTSSASVGSTSNSVNIEAERNTPDLSLSNVQPTIPCAIPINASGVATAFGLGFGTAYIDKACEERELIRLGLASNDSNTNSLANTVLQTRLAEVLKPKEAENSSASNYESLVSY